jgi:hypothetical protein
LSENREALDRCMESAQKTERAVSCAIQINP